MSRFILIVGFYFLVNSNHADSLLEGASCDNSGVQGTCRKAKHCPSYTVMPVQQSEATLCSNDGSEDIVCCTDCHPDYVSKEATPALSLDGIVWKTGGVRKHYDKCVDYAINLPYPCKDGVRATLRKVYDTKKKCHRIDVNLEQDLKAVIPERVDFPNLALLGFTYKNSGLIHWQCEGFIISERFIITTAHWGHSVSTGRVVYVAVGIDKRTEGDTPSSWQQYKVKRYIQHPEWHNPHKYNDIRLVETMTEIQFGVNVLPMCLGDYSSDPETVQADILGTDAIHNNIRVQLQKLNQTECSKLFTANRLLKDGLNFTTQTCYNGFNETAEIRRAWQWGSSGRPIYVSGELKCMNYVVGFSSFGHLCDHPDSATVYTRIQTFIPWIESIVWP